MTATQDTIREVAYYRWKEAGEPTGDDLRFWLEAEHECGSCQEANESTRDRQIEEASMASFPASDPRAGSVTKVGSSSRVPAERRK